ncbi:MAG TPA: type II methionyl aminopeptidase [Nanoarchaeota archaeon]|nr:type II methionyl aminopeptidase [Nanoarchaeota archaeon]HIH50992.1 type II methionyl aminopeptidase [Nanoarchaeota archaeon]HIH66134.1 type II methionyl aminopeptidase [Nanoarchaeota archaeon]
MQINSGQDLDKWRKAGRITAEVKKFARPLVKKGKSVLELADEIEMKILELGGKPAFPVNIGINEKAAHYVPSHDDASVFGEDLVKIDFGVSIDGFSADNAFTIDLSSSKKHAKLIKAAEDAMHEAIKLARPGVEVREIGARVHEIITNEGFSPIVNLSGHEIRKFVLHAGLTIPNYDNKNNTELEEGMVIAIEPFATTGQGSVRDGKESDVYSLSNRRAVRDASAREVLSFIEEEYSTLPFAGRWIFRKFGQRGLNALKLLAREGILHNYHELIEVSGAPVAQAENTIIVGKEPEVITEL